MWLSQAARFFSYNLSSLCNSPLLLYRAVVLGHLNWRVLPRRFYVYTPVWVRLCHIKGHNEDRMLENTLLRGIFRPRSEDVAPLILNLNSGGGELSASRYWLFAPRKGPRYPSRRTQDRLQDLFLLYKEKIFPWKESKSDPSIVKSIAQLLYRLSYLGYWKEILKCN